MDKREEHFQEAKEFIDKILEKCKDKQYIFRGITQVYDSGKKDRVSSSLYRKYKVIFKFSKSSEHLLPASLEKEIVKRARSHFPINSSNIEILTDLRHFGSEQTTLIDFTYNMYIALFFSCNGDFDKDGELLLLDTEKIREVKDISYPDDNKEVIEEVIIKPAHSQSSRNRVIFQSSVFVYAPAGYVNKEYILPFRVKKQWKMPILNILRRCHDIHSSTVYNDIFGFISNDKTYENALVEFYTGIEATMKKEHEKAIEYYAKAIELKPDLAEAYVQRADAKRTLGRHKEAIGDFTKAIELKPDDADAYSLRGSVRIEIEDKEGAAQDFTKAIELEPDAKTYVSRGIVRNQLEDKEGAIQDFTKAIELRPAFAYAYVQRADAKHTLGRHKEAFDDFEKAIELKPDYAEAYLQRGNAKLDLGDKEDAAQDFTRAIELKPELRDSY